MTARVAGGEQEQLDQLAAEFPGWHIWQSAAGRAWATRRGNIPGRRDRDADWAMTVDGDTAEDLRAALKVQVELDGLTTSGAAPRYLPAHGDAGGHDRALKAGSRPGEVPRRVAQAGAPHQSRRPGRCTRPRYPGGTSWGAHNATRKEQQMTETIAPPSAAQAETARRIDALDLDPIAYKMMYPEPGEQVMTLAEADQLIAAYRQFVKLCAWYPDESIVPSKPIDEVWHTHILDTAKYAADSQSVFGRFMHHFPYFGLRGPDDEAELRAAFGRTRELFLRHFGIDPGTELVAGRCAGTGNHCDEAECNTPGPQAAAECMHDGQSCNQDGSLCVEAECERSPVTAKEGTCNNDGDDGTGCIGDRPPGQAGLSRPRPVRAC